jgi:hypothetical protein
MPARSNDGKHLRVSTPLRYRLSAATDYPFNELDIALVDLILILNTLLSHTPAMRYVR